MYCGKCGKEYAEGSSFCANCGNTLNSQQKNKFNLKINKKVIIGIIAIVLVVGGIVSIVNSVSAKNNTPEKAAEKFVVGLVGGDIEELVGCLPEFYKKSFMDQYDLPLDSKDKDLIKALEDESGDYDFEEIEIIGSEIVEDLDVDDVRDYLSYQYEDYYKYEETNKTTSALIVQVHCYRDGDYDDSDGFYVTCIEMDEVWYPVDID